MCFANVHRQASDIVHAPDGHLDLSRCPLLHKSLQPPVLQTERVVIQPESSGCRWLAISCLHVPIKTEIHHASDCRGWRIAIQCVYRNLHCLCLSNNDKQMESVYMTLSAYFYDMLS